MDVDVNRRVGAAGAVVVQRLDRRAAVGGALRRSQASACCVAVGRETLGDLLQVGCVTLWWKTRRPAPCPPRGAWLVFIGTSRSRRPRSRNHRRSLRSPALTAANRPPPRRRPPSAPRRRTERLARRTRDRIARAAAPVGVRRDHELALRVDEDALAEDAACREGAVVVRPPLVAVAAARLADVGALRCRVGEPAVCNDAPAVDARTVEDEEAEAREVAASPPGCSSR